MLVQRCRRLFSGYIVAGLADRLRDLCQSKIQNLGMPAFGHEDVGGLDVPVDNTSAVSSIERIRNLNSKPHYLVHLHRLAADLTLQGQPVQKLHDDEWLLSLLADLVNRTDIGMIESRRGTSFTPEAFQCLGVTG